MRRQPALLMIAILLLTLIAASPVPASAPEARAAGLPVAQQEAKVFLPLISRGHRICSPDSPFSVQIAALHQIGGDPRWGAPTGGRPYGREAWQEWYDAVFPDLVVALKQTGACWVRVLIDWESIQPTAPLPGEPSSYNWTYHDVRLALLAETGIQIIGQVEMVPEWARGEPYNGPPPDGNPSLRCTSIDPERFSDLAQFLTDVVNRYKGPPYNVRVWELRNEPDGTTPDRALGGQGCAGFRGDLYAQMLPHAYQAIKAADPAATVLMGGVASDLFVENGGPFHRYFADDVFATVLADPYGVPADYLDAFAFHYFEDFHREWERWLHGANPPTCGIVDDGVGQPYDVWGIDVIAKTNHLRNRLATCSGVNMPMWITEIGAQGHPRDPDDPDDPNTEAQQARYVIQAYGRALSAGIKNITWYVLITPDYEYGAQGLVYVNSSGQLVAKDAFFAYQTLTAQLEGWAFDHALVVDGVEGYVFRNALGEKKVVAWARREPLTPAYLPFPGKTQLHVVDRQGKVSVIHDGGPGDADGLQDGTVTLELPGAPVDPDPTTPPSFSAEPFFIRAR